MCPTSPTTSPYLFSSMATSGPLYLLTSCSSVDGCGSTVSGTRLRGSSLGVLS